MSRIAKNPVTVPKGTDVNLQGQLLKIKGTKGALEHEIHEDVEVTLTENVLTFAPRKETKESNALAGTTRALVNNMVVGASKGFEKKLTLVGVGYRAQVQGTTLNLTLGFSHPVNFAIPTGITIETPSQTEVIVKGADRQQVGQVAANIRAYRPPEPYKGKGVRYADEVIIMKEVKKK
ncbi:ribosomal protein L6, bacterial type [Beggiatoa alba B18LD]|uniref:Large ribosomal subunit protein uL6 n=1 Tax=Beggiatoa alba B18LD TaxID=395493 RepID=I3CIK8_9GAMM|nr:50S ribosomal protein L6 [Beggiatoa alba]EIJ43451.1 ribosomal protein L6, bacterial type [Beggiatoa alba B18LD]